MVSDVSGNGNNGTISGATWTSSGKYGNALMFNGTSALVTVHDSVSLQLTAGMTLEAWVYPTQCEQRVAGRDLQGQRQLLSGGDFKQFKSSGDRGHFRRSIWRSFMGRVRCR